MANLVKITGDDARNVYNFPYVVTNKDDEYLENCWAGFRVEAEADAYMRAKELELNG